MRAAPEEGTGEGAAIMRDAGTLYVVATPIGHLGDLSARATEVLRAVDCVAAEDTRVSQTLLGHVGARPASLLAAHSHNEHEAGARVVERLLRGESVALVTDAGTPALSDPGARVVAAAHAAGVRVVPVPGPSAATAMLSVSGLGGGRFRFEGFLPTQGGALAARLRAVAASDEPVVLFEAPHRIVETMDALRHACGDDRPAAIGRELTKRFEQLFTGTLARAVDWLQESDDHRRGEFVLVVGAAPAAEDDGVDGATLDRTLSALLAEMPASRAARLAAHILGCTRARAYDRALALGRGRRGEDGEAADAEGDGARRGTGAADDRGEPPGNLPDHG